jgi:hypothetical protein
MQTKKPTLKQRYNDLANRAAVVATPIILATAAHAEGGLDTSSATTQLGYALAAVGAIGAVKLAPAALSWVWSMVTRNASRG